MPIKATNFLVLTILKTGLSSETLTLLCISDKRDQANEDTRFIKDFSKNKEEFPGFLKAFFCKRDNKFLNVSSKHLYLGEIDSSY